MSNTEPQIEDERRAAIMLAKTRLNYRLLVIQSAFEKGLYDEARGHAERLAKLACALKSLEGSTQ